ncbi:hypothetical protein [Streptomyces sp. NPDC051079]|uniref:hypothetical protein n=1 Tax=Streptomyces sp. NPDC051079 TaxID=3155043 RepID=UPI0034510356
MRITTPGTSVTSSIEITSTNVQIGDVILIGGLPHRVVDLSQLPGGAKQLRFESGELLTMHTRTRLAALRMRRVGDRRRGFSPTRHRR